MRTWILILVLSLAAAGQDGTRPEGLTLVSRHVDLEVVENLALLQVRIKVANPTDRALEGDLSFTAPRGAAVYGMSLLKHIASTERNARLLLPETASALYAADMARQREGPEDFAMRGSSPAGGTRTTGTTTPVAGGVRGTPGSVNTPRFNTPPPTNSPTTPPVAGGVPGTPASANTPRFNTPLLTGTSSNPGSRLTGNALVNQTILVSNGTNIRSNDLPPIDPALLERVSIDRYRLRFFPVPPRDTQTVTVLLAFEAMREGHAYAAIVPLRLDSNAATTDASRSTVRISLASADALKTVTCSSHGLRSVERDEDGRRFRAAIDPLGDVADLALSYDLGFWAKPQEFGENGRSASALTSPQAAAFRALVSKRALDRADDPVLGLSSGVASAHGSFLAIPKNDARDLAREAGRGLRPDSGPAGPASDEDLRECEFVRAAMKLPARSWAPRCEARAVSTNDPAKVQWARDNGIVSGRSNGLLQGASFEYVKHAPGCRVQEPNTERLRQQAEALK